VRVHADAGADALNQALQARAFTSGQDVFFRRGAYNPSTSSGRELLAHELTHVVQQADGARPKLTIGRLGDRYEQEADRVARSVMQQEQQSIRKVTDEGLVQRQIEEEEEEEKPLQAKVADAQVQQQIEEEEEEEPIQTVAKDAWVQRQMEEEQEETIQTKPVTSSHSRRLGQTNVDFYSQHLKPLIQRDNGSGASGPASASTATQSPYDAIQDFVEDSAEEWRFAKDRFDRALRFFTRRMGMASEDEAVPDVTGALVKHVTDTVTKAALNKLETLIPGWAEVKGALDAMIGELDRAETASREVSLRDFLDTTDDIMSEGFENQIRAVRTGRQDLREQYDSVPPEIQPLIIDSLSNWLEAIRREVPSANDYKAALFIEYLNRHYGQLQRYTVLGIIQIKFNAERRGSYDFESAKVQAPFANKVASGLNWVMSTPELGMRNVLELPIRKHVGLYTENLVGGTSYGWFRLDEGNHTLGESVLPVARRRWHEMPWEPLQAITRVSH
jgi:hypothetical protein